MISELRALVRDPNKTVQEPLDHGARSGHVARTITRLRNEMGMSVEELAERAAIEPEFLRYFEGSSVATLSTNTLLLLALALNTTPLALSGDQGPRPSGDGWTGRHPVLDALNRDQCEAHLQAGGVGRVIVSTERGPIAFPGNFEFKGGAIVFSTEETKAIAIQSQAVVGFEIDKVDDALSVRWSVMVTGHARRVPGTREVHRHSSIDLVDWATDARHALIAIEPKEITGRVIQKHARYDH